MGFYVDARRLKSGKEIYRFTFTDTDGKRKRLPIEKTPHFDSKKEAEAWAKTQEAHIESMKAKVAERLRWKKKYVDFTDHIEKFMSWYQYRG